MSIKKIGIRELANNLSVCLKTYEEFAITCKGYIIGYFVRMLPEAYLEKLEKKRKEELKEEKNNKVNEPIIKK